MPDIWYFTAAKVTDFLENGRWTDALLLLLLLLAALALLVIGDRFLSSTKRLPPGPWSLPIVGFLPFMSRDAPFVTLTNFARRYGAIYRVQFGRVPAVIVSDPSLVQAAFNKEAFNGRPNLFLMTGLMENYGIFGSEGERWKEQRRFVAKTLRSFGITKSLMLPSAVQMQSRMVDEISSLHRKMRQSEGRSAHYHRHVQWTLANLVTNLLFSETYDDNDPILERQLENLDLGTELVDVSGPLHFLPFLRFLPKFRRLFERIWELKGGSEKFYTAFIDERQKRGPGGDDDDDDDYSNDRDFLSIYLAEMSRRNPDGKGPSHFDSRQLIHVLSDLMGGSIETTTATIDWTFIYLMLNPAVQSKCQQEMDTVVGRGRDPTLEDRTRCPYLSAALLEAQRLASVVPLGAPHGAVEDAFLGGYFIPKGTMIVALLWSIHMDPKFWPEPNAFRPERFLDDNGKVRVPEHFMPFSAGKRICVGEEFAKMMIFLVVAITLHRFTLRLPDDDDDDDDEADRRPDMTPIPGIIIKPRPYRMRAIARSSTE